VRTIASRHAEVDMVFMQAICACTAGFTEYLRDGNGNTRRKYVQAFILRISEVPASSWGPDGHVLVVDIQCY